jgi:Na+-transporting methylmalonyl-CoA/oxaloacetate decarboxylase gamma subunit
MTLFDTLAIVFTMGMTMWIAFLVILSYEAWTRD